MKKILALICIYMLSFCGIGSVATDNIKIDNEKSASYKFETEYWAVIISTNTTNITSIYNSIIDKPNWNESHIILLKREEATKENILDALDWLAVNSDSQDIVLFSFTGHGTYNGTHNNRKYGIAPWGHNPIFVDVLDEKLNLIDCKHMCLIFDCCLSGSFVGRKSIFSKENNIFQCTEFFISNLDDQDRVILMSTRRLGGGFSASILEDGIEVNVISFARFVADAFQNGIDNDNNGWVSAEEGFRYGRRKFRPYAIIIFLFIPLQIQAFIQSRGFFIIPFPTIYDGVEGELPLVKI